jgi:hypothetical protein
MAKKKEKRRFTMDELVKRAEKLLEDKELNPKGKELFEKTLKRSVKGKRSAK